MLVLLVHLGDKRVAQEVGLLKLRFVDSLWLAEHFLLLTALLVSTLLLCPPFACLVFKLQLMLCMARPFNSAWKAPCLIAKAAALPAAKRCGKPRVS